MNLVRVLYLCLSACYYFQIAKKHVGNGSVYEKTKVSTFCIELLVDLYLTAAPKNPLKCAISRFVFCCFFMIFTVLHSKASINIYAKWLLQNSHSVLNELAILTL
jgi:hypothetical protein